MASKKAKKRSARKPQRSASPKKPRKKRNPTTTAVQKYAAKAPSRPRFKRRNPTPGFNLTKFGLIMGGGLVGYIGGNVAGKAVAGLVPVDYQNMVRIGTKAAVTVGAAVLLPKYVNSDFALGVAVGAGIGTVEDGVKTYLTGWAPTFFAGLDDAGAWNTPGTIEISGEEIERTPYLMPSNEVEQVRGVVTI